RKVMQEHGRGNPAVFFLYVVTCRTCEIAIATCRSRRQLCPVLLRHHVRCVPVGPVLVALPEEFFVLSVGSLGAPKRAGHFARRGERGAGGVDAPGQTAGDLLQKPAVTVGVME